MNDGFTTTAPGPFFKVNNGIEMPAIGLGVFQNPPEETASAVEAALLGGYRLIDTAAAYLNEHEVGEGIRRSGIPRDEVFLETKVWISDYGYDATLHAFDKSTRKLGVERLDLVLLHQPLTSAFERTLAAYRALERLLADGRVRAIDFALTAEQVAAIDALDTGVRGGPEPDSITLEAYGVPIPEA